MTDQATLRLFPVHDLPVPAETGDRRYFVLEQTDDDLALFVAFTLRGNPIRVIWARDMSRRERKVYQG